MGKTEIIGIILITLVLFVWMYLNSPKQLQSPQKQVENEQAVQPGQSNAPTAKANSGTTTNMSVQKGVASESAMASRQDSTELKLYGKTFAPLTHGTAKTMIKAF